LNSLSKNSKTNEFKLYQLNLKQIKENIHRRQNLKENNNTIAKNQDGIRYREDIQFPMYVFKI
jgi:hypothetical protein